jgi:hypothetical protein
MPANADAQKIVVTARAVGTRASNPASFTRLF